MAKIVKDKNKNKVKKEKVATKEKFSDTKSEIFSDLDRSKQKLNNLFSKINKFSVE